MASYRYWKSNNDHIYLQHTFGKMRNFNKQLLCMLMLIPMMVLLAHDVIPHHHHIHNNVDDQQISAFHVHQDLLENTCSQHNHNSRQWSHHDDTKNKSCCTLTHHRVQKEVRFQIFLKADSIQLDSENSQKVQRFRVHNHTLIPEPIRISPLRRGPPSTNLA